MPPPVVAALFALLMWFAAVPSLDIPIPFREVIAAVLVLAAVSIGVSAVLGFRREKTTLNPLQPEAASALVVRGIYRWTRNPMYLAMLLVLAAWACIISNVVALAMLPLFVMFMNRFQVAPEERALHARFGAEFENYRRRVRRWL